MLCSLVYIAVAILSFRAVYLTGNPLSCDKSQLNDHCTFIPSEQGGFQLTPKYVIDDPLILLQASQDNVTIQLYCSYPACLSNPCHNGGVCQETLEGFNCSYVGPFYGETCTDFDCPDNWPPRLHGQESCYLFRENLKNWATANDSCINLGGALLALETEAELRAMGDVIVSIYGLSNSFIVWTGLNDHRIEGVYEWVGFNGTLEASTPNMWHLGEPNDFAGAQDCVAFYGDEIKLGDISCLNEYSYVCEFHY